MRKLFIAAAMTLALVGAAEATSRPPTPRATCYSFITIWFIHVPIPVPCSVVEAPPPGGAQRR